jgi:hypothetical protein
MMGATTICPGSHWCANDNLSKVCKAPDAFEVSSNGRTGINEGVLYTGDGVLFNQNIWHRGPANKDSQRPLNRVMFILTFVSRLDKEHADVRQQGIGTFYYQRWNMWGHTWNDLKHASWTFLQPMAVLRALGLWKLPGSKWGILWLEHFARQIANDEDFFSSSELKSFLRFLDSHHVPRWFQGRSPMNGKDIYKPLAIKINGDHTLKWESFLMLLVDRIAILIHAAHLTVTTLYFFWTWWFAPKGSRQKTLRTFATNTILKYCVTALVFAASWFYVTKFSYLSQRIHMRETWRQPFAKVGSLEHLKRTTFPNRDDILVGSRFDAPHLASFDRLLDYHPGNKKLLDALQHDTILMPSLIQAYVKPGRFLQQDWKTGYWMLMTNEEVQTHLSRQLYAQNHSLTARMDQHIKHVLADARFGWQRNTAMARQFIPAICSQWQSVLFSPLATRSSVLIPAKKSTGPRYLTAPKPLLQSLSTNKGSLVLRTKPRTFPSIAGRKESSPSFVQGDLVYVLEDFLGRASWSKGRTLLIDPFGNAFVQYLEVNGTEKVVKVNLDRLRRNPIANSDNSSQLGLQKGTRVMARYKNGRRYFPGRIVNVFRDGIYAVRFDDGDYDAGVPREHIRLMASASVQGRS